MGIISLIQTYALLLFVFFAAGCAVSLVREFRKGLSPKQDRLLKVLEWCLLPPGFAAIFVTVQQCSVRYFALYPQWTVSVFVGVAAFSALLIFVKRKKRHTALVWLGGLLGVPGVAFSLILLGMFFQSPKQFAQLRTTYNKLAATEGQSAPNFPFILMANREVRHLADYRGKIVLLNIWATWCVPCLEEMPDLDRLQKKLGSTGLAVINLSDEKIETIDRYLAKHPMVTTHGRVEKQDVPEFYQFGSARPTTFLIGTDGKVIKSVVGAKDMKYFESILNQAKH